MKILRAIETLDSEARVSVASARSLMPAQARLGHGVAIVHHAPRKSTWSLAKNNQLMAGRFDDHSIPRGLLERHFAHAAVSARLARAQRIDVVPVYGMWRSVNSAVYRAGLKAGRRFVITTHDRRDRRRFMQRRFHKLRMLALIWKNLLDMVFFLNALNATDASPLAPLGSAPDRRDVPFLSRLRYKEGLNYLIEVFAQFTNDDREPDLVIAGPPECW